MKLQLLAYTLGATVPIYLIDRYLIYRGYNHENHRWCAIHTVVNAAVVALSCKGLVAMLSSDQTQSMLAGSSEFNIGSSIVVMAAHLYHLLRFKVTDPSLLTHHILMMSVLTIPYFNSTNQRFMYVTDSTLFFMCGLPGMIDYFCMCLYYSGWMSSYREKRINNYLNAYIRAPGILYAAFTAHRYWVNGLVPGYVAIPVIGSLVWNAQYFSNLVAISYGAARRNIDDLSPGKSSGN
jgi:hypothetical protein